jgi:hypothetical protein
VQINFAFSVDGVSATGSVNTVNVWTEIDASQTPSYSTIDAAQTPNWVKIAA